jgi:DNA-directed RNA polymerase subunit M/transcription elongation factor TFIIS
MSNPLVRAIRITVWMWECPHCKEMMITSRDPVSAIENCDECGAQSIVRESGSATPALAADFVTAYRAAVAVAKTEHIGTE